MVRTEQDYIILPGGVHVWGPQPEFLGAVPDETVAKESRGHRIHQFEIPGWRMLESKNVVVTSDAPEEALQILAVTGEELNKMLIRELGGPRSKSRYRIRVFEKREDFCRYAAICGGPNATSLYDPRQQEMAFSFSPQTNQWEFEETFAHEFTHAYMDKVYRVTAPLWFAEGMAEYFSRLEWTERGFKPTGKNENAAMHGQTVGGISLMDVLKAAKIDIYGINYPEYYAACWGVISFLLKKHPEVVEALLKKEIVILDLLEREYSSYIKRRLGV
jgi:hypothetical protein